MSIKDEIFLLFFKIINPFVQSKVFYGVNNISLEILIIIRDF